MAIASLLTVLALTGVSAGLLLGEKRKFSAHLSAAGGGVLLGLAVFWLLPEIAEGSDWLIAVACPAAACGILLLMDRFFQHHDGEPGEQLIWPLLGATAVHSFLDGWSVRALSGELLTGVAVPVGLALHKVPEGLALGWITRRSFPSRAQALSTSAAVELFTLAGAFVEPRANASGAQLFGTWWTVAVLAVITGSFAFLGVHAILPARRRTGVLAVFFLTLLAVGGAAAVKR